MGITERIIEVLKDFEVGLTYKNLLEQYKKNYHEELLWGYEHIKRLRNKNIVESFKAQNTKGKALTYRLIATKELKDIGDNKYKKIVMDLLDGKNISEEEYAYITRDN